ncbi:unnamed protein product, partial [Tetraodon nigroviridis]
MVEGPGCALNGEKIRSKVQKGQEVIDVRGTLTKSKHGAVTCYFGSNLTGLCLQKSDVYRTFCGYQYTGVDTLGKELFMYFGSRALRVHFGMNGSMRINPAERKDRSSSMPVLEIHLTNDIVCFFDSTVEARSTEDCVQKVRAMEGLDVCSQQFSFSRSEEAARSQCCRMLCDVLMDQAVMPGVGNIIKNEALFDSGLHPAVKVEQLTAEQLRHVVKMTRDFTLLFYKQAPSEKQLVLAGLTRTRTVYDVAKKEEEDWACQLCTLINQPAAEACDACLTPRPEVHKEGISAEALPLTSDLMKYPCIAFKKPQEELKVNWRSAFGTSTLVFSNMSKKPKSANSPLSPAASHSNSLATDKGLYKYSICQGTTSPNYASGGWQRQSAELSNGESVASYSHPSKKMRMDHSPFPSNNAQNGTLNSRSQQTESSSTSAPCCTSHHRPAALRVVHKQGENKGRQFYVCSLPRENQCNFFEWADLHFPTCHHGKRCLMRTVLKLGPNNGRNFFTCSFQKGKQCDFFQWAHSEAGLSILPGC